VGAAASRRVLTLSIYNKKRTVFNKRVRPLPAFNTLNYPYGAGCRASCIKRLRTACWGGRGAGTPAPEKQTLRQNFQGSGKLRINLILPQIIDKRNQKNKCIWP